ncbi:MAG: AraC family transcriptional regulator [Verrucomicrobia bacterium]|nr:AraC family transcriptional regulator [Verrucomicrobiota bacterium]
MPYHGTRFRWQDRRVHTANVVIGDVVYQPRGACGPRAQRDFQLVILHSGECQLQLDGAAHQLKADRVYLLRPGGREYFQFAADRESHHSWCAVRPRIIPNSLAACLRRTPLSAPCSALFHSLLENALKLRFSREASFRILVEGIAVCLLAEFFHAASEAESGVYDDIAVRNFLLCVEDHFGEESCLKAARAAAGVSRNSLFQRLRRMMETTPAKYLWQFRAERGAAMLAETGQTVAEIAYRCGFKNPFHFSRMLKRCFGKSPKEIRQQAWARE